MRAFGRLFPCVLAPLVGGCDGYQSMLQPDGPIAESIARLWWVLFGVGTLVFVAVCVALAYAIGRRPRGAEHRPPLPISPDAEDELRDNPEARAAAESTRSAFGPSLEIGDLHTPERSSVRWVLFGGALMPAIVLIPVLLATLLTLAANDWRDREPAVTIEVIGHQWWWEVIYRDAQGGPLFETANEIHLPVGAPVRLLVRSADVIHSFWVPQLAGKKDMIPGHTADLWLQADQPGFFRGQCAEYCDGPHAFMLLAVIAEPPEEFERWLAVQRADAPEPSSPLAFAGRGIFETTACAACHAIRGTAAAGGLGPDLTHFASRATIGAGLLPNTRGNLGGWLTNPQELKPAVRMPAVPLTGPELAAVLAYLETLR